MFVKSKSIAVKAAVLAFLAVSLVCQISGIDAIVCLTRALLGSIAVYVIITLVIKIVNALLFNAIINKQLEEHIKKQNGDKN
ncbi:MAG: hypothetical protein WC765_11400 [Phycisphaerae bacterium]|jgi:hypothetical protein